VWVHPQLLSLEQYWDVFGDKYGSHVAQTLLDVATRLLLSCDSDAAAELLQRLVDRLLALSDDMGSTRWIGLMQDTYACHVGRSLLRLLAVGEARADEDAKGASEQGQRLCAQLAGQVDAAAQSILGGVAGPAQLRDMMNGSYSVPVLQLLLELHPVPGVLAKRLLGWEGEQLPGDAESKAHLQSMLTDQAGSHLLEAVIAALPDGEYYTLFAGCFRGKLLELSQDKVANFVVQKLVGSAKRAPHVSLIAAELSDGAGFATLFKQMRGSVVLAVVKAAGQFEVKQKQVFKAVVRALADPELPAGAASTSAGESMLQRLLTLPDAGEGWARQQASARPSAGPGSGGARGKKKGRKAKPAICSSVGAQIAQQLLGFEPAHTQPLLAAFRAASLTELSELARDAAGSRLLEGFITCPAHRQAPKPKAAPLARGGIKVVAKAAAEAAAVVAAEATAAEARQNTHQKWIGRWAGAPLTGAVEGSASAAGVAEAETPATPQTLLASLATDKFGSRCVEALYTAAELGRKKAIAGDLAAAQALLKADFFGRIALAKCRVYIARGGGALGPRSCLLL
jgi:hypothetical protein